MLKLWQFGIKKFNLDFVNFITLKFKMSSKTLELEVETLDLAKF
jgi:hypothetical protein